MVSTFTPASWESPLDMLLAVSKHVSSNESIDHCTRVINFMSYDLNSKTQNLPPEEKLLYLNDLFFGVKGFKVSSEPYSIDEILNCREGSAIGLALLYIHLAQTIDLKIQLVHWPLHAVLRWRSENKTQFIDLEQRGRLLNEDELLSLITKHNEQVKTLNSSEAFLQYLSYISVGLRQKKDLEKVLIVLNLMLEVEPDNMRFLAERALLKKELGHFKSALSDFKRYFSFVEPQHASYEMVENFNMMVEKVRLEQSPSAET